MIEFKDAALGLINAMILEGPDNEQELHLLQVLIEPEAGDDLESAVRDAQAYIKASYDDMNKMLDKFEDFIPAPLDDNSVYADSRKRIEADEDAEFKKLLELKDYLDSKEVQDTLGTGKYTFKLGFGDKVISFYDLAQMYNDFYDMIVNAIREY